MANAAICYTNLADTGTVTASTQVLLAPANNLQNAHVARKWRSTGTTDYFIFDLGSVQAFNAVAVMGLTAATVRLRCSTLDATCAVADVWDSGVVTVEQAYCQFVDLHGGSTRYVRVDLTALADNAYCEAGRVFIGESFGFGTNFSYGWGRKWNDPSLKVTTRGGQTQVSNETTYRSIQVMFNDLSASEVYGDLEEIDRVNALKTDVLFITNAASTNLERDSIWGLMTDLSTVTQPYFSRFSKQYSIEERR